MFITRIIFCLLATTCFLSFAWAIGKHFIKSDEGTPKLMNALSLVGVAFTALQLLAVVTTDKFRFVSSIIGVVLYLASLSLFWWAVSTTRRTRLSLAFSSDKPRYLLRSGPYRFIRHPFYSAYTLFWLAGVVTTLFWWLAIPVVIVFAFYLRAASMEEAKFSSSNLSLDYQDYRKRTGMFFPKI